MCMLQRWVYECVCYKDGFMNVYATKVRLNVYATKVRLNVYATKVRLNVYATKVGL